MRSLVKSLRSIFIILSFSLSISIWAKPALICSDYKFTDINSSSDLASLMGKHKIFDISLMMKYDDDAKINLGEVILIKDQNDYAQVLVRVALKKDYWVYKSSEGIILKRKISKRNIASADKIINLCSGN